MYPSGVRRGGRVDGGRVACSAMTEGSRRSALGRGAAGGRAQEVSAACGRCQATGSNSSSRLSGWDRTRGRTSARYVSGFTSLARHVATSEYTTASGGTKATCPTTRFRLKSRSRTGEGSAQALQARSGRAEDLSGGRRWGGMGDGAGWPPGLTGARRVPRLSVRRYGGGGATRRRGTARVLATRAEMGACGTRLVLPGPTLPREERP
jgi:hypothetical protein